MYYHKFWQSLAVKKIFRQHDIEDGATIAQWICLLLPSCGQGFKSHYAFIVKLCTIFVITLRKGRLETKKWLGLAQIKKTVILKPKSHNIEEKIAPKSHQNRKRQLIPINIVPVARSEGFSELIGLQDLPDDQRVQHNDGDVRNCLENKQFHPHLEIESIN